MIRCHGDEYQRQQPADHRQCHDQLCVRMDAPPINVSGIPITAANFTDILIAERQLALLIHLVHSEIGGGYTSHGAVIFVAVAHADGNRPQSANAIDLLVNPVRLRGLGKARSQAHTYDLRPGGNFPKGHAFTIKRGFVDVTTVDVKRNVCRS
jgi:hypothetical protein